MTTEAGAAIAQTIDHGGLAKPGRNIRGTFKLGDIALRIIAGLVLLYLFLPILVIVIFSFNNPAGKSTTPGRASRSTIGPTRSSTRL